MQEWKTIDSAPRDGTIFIACDDKYPRAYLCRWDGYIDRQQGLYPQFSPPRPEDMRISTSCYGASYLYPTHWMPLPKPPVT